MKKKILSALLATSILLGSNFIDSPNAEAESVQNIAKISVDASGKNFKYWNPNAPALQKLKAYVADVTNPKSPNYIPPEDRICVSDMDGTLYAELAPTWAEWCFYFHRIFDDPTYSPSATEKAYAQRCLEAVKGNGRLSDMDAGEDSAQSYAFEGMTLDDFDEYARAFLKTTPLDGLSNCTFAEAFYLPMVEVISYLHANDFEVYVVTGSDRQLARKIMEAIPSIKPSHVIGTDSEVIAQRQGFGDPKDFKFDQKSDVMVRGSYMSTTSGMVKVDKIVREIGKRPVIALGNSGSDTAMMNYAIFNPQYNALTLGILCDDTARDWGDANKAQSFKSTCDQFGWTSVSMRDDWKTIYGSNVKKVDQKFHNRKA